MDSSLREPMAQAEHQQKSRISQDFSALSVLGKGGFGKVLEVYHHIDTKSYAVKQIPIRYGKSVRLHKICKELGIHLPNVPGTSEEDSSCEDGEELNLEEKKLLEKYKKGIQEVKILPDLSHQNVIRYHISWLECMHNDQLKSGCENAEPSEETEEISDDLYTDESDSQGNLMKQDVSEYCLVLCILMEKCDATLKARTLTEYELSIPFDPLTYIQLFLQFLNGLQYIHEEGIIHRDLKPDNILLIEKRGNLLVKIADFGAAKEIEKCISTSANSEVGTSCYTSPEQLAGYIYDTKTDMYSVGVILAEIWACFKSGMERAICLEGLREEQTDFLESFHPKEVGDLAKKLTRKDLSQRPSASECLDFLKKIEDTMTNKESEGTKTVQNTEEEFDKDLHMVQTAMTANLLDDSTAEELGAVGGHEFAEMKTAYEALKKEHEDLKIEYTISRVLHKRTTDFLDEEVCRLRGMNSSLLREKRKLKAQRDKSTPGHQELLEAGVQVKDTPQKGVRSPAKGSSSMEKPSQKRSFKKK